MGPFHKLAAPARALLGDLRLPQAARVARWRDRAGLPARDRGIEAVVRGGVAWLCRAQDCSASADGGVARHYSLISGWSSSYPETTGYIAPTMLAVADLWQDESLRQRARRMLDWLCRIQLPEGGFQGGRIDSTPVVPVTFNTGQILLGLAAGTRAFGDAYREPMRRAADWLVKTQDPDGCWRQHPTPFAKYGEKSYDTHVAWGLLEAARVDPERPYADAALANVRWALRSQRENGWLDKCCLNNPCEPLTHTLGYALRGIIEAYRFSGELRFLEAAKRTGGGLLSALGGDGFLPGRLHPDWTGAAAWCCLTGSVQVAECWLMLFACLGEPAWRDAACAVNRYVRRTVQLDASPDIRGGVQGSFPVDGGYGTYEYLNWACKFCIDANLRERSVTSAQGDSGA